METKVLVTGIASHSMAKKSLTALDFLYTARTRMIKRRVVALLAIAVMIAVKSQRTAQLETGTAKAEKMSRGLHMKYRGGLLTGHHHA